jgi:hypothetical protein
MALLPSLHMLFMRAAAFAAGLLVLLRRSLFRIGILVALFARLDVLFVGAASIIGHGVSPLA